MSRSEFNNKALTIDGTPQFVLCGELQQYRLPACQWRDRLEKMAALGLNCIGVYAGWNFHSPDAGVYDFETPDRDFGTFLDEAKRAGLFVMVRPGPYVCNEWDLGGFPGWLLRESPEDWRTGQTEHVKYSLEWYRRINDVIEPRQIDKDGSVVLYQLENEHWWGDKALFDALYEAARGDGITVPLISNGGGSARRCGNTTIVDGCDIYTNVYENWRWRGWAGLASRLAGEAPLMVIEYNGSSGALWGEPPAGEEKLPSEWMMSLTRMFMGLGANLVNPFVIAGGITPVGFGSDHICTAYGEDAAISHWGGLGTKFYLLRLLAEAVSSINESLAVSKPAPDFWATDSGYVEGMLRESRKGKFIVAVNNSTHTEEFHLVLPDGRQMPQAGSIAIAPRVSQFHMVDIDCGGDVVLEYSTSQVLKIWQNSIGLNIVVYDEPARAGHAMLIIDSNRVRVDFVCRPEVDVVRVSGATIPINLFATSTQVAQRTWFTQVRDGEISALFGNLDLVRPQCGATGILAEIERSQNLCVITDGILLSIDGADVSVNRRADGMIEHVGKAGGSGCKITLGAPSYRKEDYSWTLSMPSQDEGWTQIEACRPGFEVITNTGVYEYVKEFDCGDGLPQYLEFLGISSAETVVYLNGEKIAVFPEKRRATFHEMDDYRLRIPLAGKIRNGRNILALTLTIIGRHNMGNPLFAGVSHPIVLYRERHVVALADWEFIDFTGRQYTAEDLDAASPALLSGKSRHVDLSDPPAMRDADLADWLDIRCIYREVEIPASMKGRPLFLECGKMDDAWCYVNGKPVGRAYHQMSATFDLSEFSREQSISIVVVGRFYWRACCIPSIVPRLVSSDTVLSTAFLRRDGADGERGRYFDVTEGFESASPPPDAQALWMHRKVCVEIPSGIVAPMFVELDESWSANALIYWNGVAIGRYSVVGPDRRFYIASGILKEQNDLVIYVDGYSASARAGEVKVGPYNEYSVMRLS